MSRRSDLVQDLFHGFYLVIPARTRCVDHVNEQIRFRHFLQGGLEGRDEAVREGLLDGNDLSMGMSHDFELAIEEGATIVRVGTEIFGLRN